MFVFNSQLSPIMALASSRLYFDFFGNTISYEASPGNFWTAEIQANFTYHDGIYLYFSTRGKALKKITYTLWKKSKKSEKANKTSAKIKQKIKNNKKNQTKKKKKKKKIIIRKHEKVTKLEKI